MIDRRSWVTGLLMRLAAAPVVVKGSREPVAYLYNGVRLPDINTVWTGEYSGLAVPYGLIYTTDSGHCLIASTEPLVHMGAEVCSAERVSYVRYFTQPDYRPGEWWGATTGFMSTVSIGDARCLWSSYDILNEDGTVFLAASEPVPVYE